jgi:hypothetical protein
MTPALLRPRSAAPAVDGDVLAALRELAVEVAALRSEVARLRVPRLAAADFAALERLLPAIRGAVGGRVFSVADLVEHAKLPTPEARALRAALGPLDAGATRRLGKLFARGLDVHVAGLLVQRVGDDRGGTVWSVGVTFQAEKGAASRDIAGAVRFTQSIGTAEGK